MKKNRIHHIDNATKTIGLMAKGLNNLQFRVSLI